MFNDDEFYRLARAVTPGPVTIDRAGLLEMALVQLILEVDEEAFAARAAKTAESGEIQLQGPEGLVDLFIPLVLTETKFYSK